MSLQSHLAEPQINATPLIDVLLVLLTMLVLTLPIATQVGEVNLPQGRPGAPPAVIELDILHDGAIYWNGEQVASLEELDPRLKSLAQVEAPPLLKVQPERRAPYERVAQVLALAQRAQVHRLSVLPVADPGLPQ